MADDRRQPLKSPPTRDRGRRRQLGHEPHQRGLNAKIHLAVDAHGLPIRVLITQGTPADCTQAGRLIEGLSADYLLADRGYDSKALIDQAKSQNMEPIIPIKKNRILQRPYDEERYKLRHLVENAFLHLGLHWVCRVFQIFTVVSLARVLFRGGTVTDAWAYLEAMANFSNTYTPLGIVGLTALLLAIALRYTPSCWAFGWKEVYCRMPSFVQAGFIVATVYAIIALSTGTAPFIYFQF